jgi:hypothetical protein
MAMTRGHKMVDASACASVMSLFYGSVSLWFAGALVLCGVARRRGFHERGGARDGTQGHDDAQPTT